MMGRERVSGMMLWGGDYGWRGGSKNIGFMWWHLVSDILLAPTEC